VVLNYQEDKETYSRIGLRRSYGNLQSYWTTTKLWKLRVVLDYYEAMETYSRIGLLSAHIVKGKYNPYIVQAPNYATSQVKQVPSVN
jgi:hypothetical protein